MSDQRDSSRQGQSAGAGRGDLRNYEFSFNFSLPSGEIEPDVRFRFRQSMKLYQLY